MVSTLVVVALVIGAVPAVAAAAPASATHGYHAGHVMLRRGARARVQALAPQNASLTHTVSYYGGKVIPNVKVYAVLWGAGTFQPEVTASSAPSISNFFTGITNSPYLDWLQEYDTNVSPVGGGSGTNQIIGRGTFGGLFTITPSAGNNGATIDDALNIQPELDAQIHAGHLPAPDANTEYFLFFRQNQVITEGGMDSVHDFCAYHNTYGPPSYASEAYYAVVPYQAGGGCGMEATAFGNLTSTVSHELIESITDPEIRLASTFAPPLGWYDRADNAEIGDLCEGVGTGDGNVVGGDGNSYFVQLGWSDAQNACVVDTGGVPSAPTNVKGTAGNGVATVSWTAPGSDGGSAITGYTVTPFAGPTALAPRVFNDTTTTETVSGLTNGTSYTFRVRARNGVGSSAQSSATAAVVPLATVATAAGDAHACAVLTAGRTVACWGLNSFGQLGDGTAHSSAIPVAVTGLTGVRALALGSVHSCALLGNGTVRCWGQGTHGQLGNGTTTSSSTPVVVSGLSGVSAIAAGRVHACALLSNHTVKCWGDNTLGQLGDLTTTRRTTPVLVHGLSGVAQLAAGGNQTCAVLTNHTVKCWGLNSSGQLGDGTTTMRKAPVGVVGITSAVAVTTRGGHTCALVAHGAVMCWGLNSSGELGIGSLTTQHKPVAVAGLTGVRAIAAGDAHTCALVGNATVWCWGANNYGQLGDGTTTRRLLPRPVQVATAVVGIACGANDSLARRSTGGLRMWGENRFGELGRGSVSNANPIAAKVTGLG